ncbi:MAG: hypothetical protein HON90_02710 [Halobacteriovoraceae bacterium]|nr:hypothetical protein [Halobacteriovoraceae bacterium]
MFNFFKRKSKKEKEFSISSQMTKLGALFFIFIIVPIAISFILYEVTNTAKNMTVKNEKTITEISILGNISSIGFKQLALYKELGAGKGENGIDILESLGELKEQYTGYIKKYYEIISDEKKKVFKVINSNFEVLDQNGKDMALAYLEEEVEKADGLKESFSKKAIVFEQDIMSVSEAAQLEVKNFNHKSANQMDERRGLAIVALVVTLVLSLVIGIFLIHSIKLIIKAEKTRQKAQRDTIKDIVEGLSSASELLQGSSTTLKDLGQSLKTGSDVQATAVESTTATMKQMKEVLKSNIESVSESEKVSDETKEKVSQGQDIMKKLVMAMQEISESRDTLNKIQEMFAAVTKKTQIINDIVFQTKLLSFNASVEAARAGEFGKGFSVVAEEMSLLAQSSGSAANEIKDILISTDDEVKNIIITINERVQYGEKITDECHKIFEEISDLNGSLGVLVDAISDSSSRNEKNLDRSSESFTEIEDINRKNKIITNQTLEQSSVIEEQASDITKSISSLKRMVLNDNNDEEVARIGTGLDEEIVSATPAIKYDNIA